MIARLGKEKFPPHLHDEYDELMDIFKKYKEDFKNCSDRSEGSISFAARNMSEDERRKCVNIFLSLYDSVTRYMPADWSPDEIASVINARHRTVRPHSLQAFLYVEAVLECVILTSIKIAEAQLS